MITISIWTLRFPMLQHYLVAQHEKQQWSKDMGCFCLVLVSYSYPMKQWSESLSLMKTRTPGPCIFFYLDIAVGAGKPATSCLHPRLIIFTKRKQVCFQRLSSIIQYKLGYKGRKCNTLSCRKSGNERQGEENDTACHWATVILCQCPSQAWDEQVIPQHVI